MERQKHQFKDQQGEELDGWQAWDASPRDGPGVFVVDTAAFDQGQIKGRWIDPSEDPAVIKAQVAQLLGREPEAGTWAIVDQVGLGPVMVPESPAVEELRLVLDEMAAQTEAGQ